MITLTVNEFGTQINPGVWTETEDPLNPGQPLRTPAGQVIKVKNAVTDAALPDITGLNLGYVSFSLDDVPAVYLSADGGTTWIGPIWSKQADIDSKDAGANAGLALTQSTTALNTATSALAVAQAGGSGGGGDVEEIYETAPGDYPPPVGTVRRLFIGQVRPTVDQGRRDRDRFLRVVWASA